VINFKATELENEIVKNYLISTLKQGLGIIDVVTPRISDLTGQSTKRSGEEETKNKKEENKDK
jgi:hypothetical protein